MRRLIAAVVLLMTACGAGPPSTGVGDGGPGTPASSVTAVRDVEYVPGWAMDVWRPRASTGNPVVVLLHGCCGDRADLTLLSLALARSGVVAFNADWGGLAPGGHPTGVVRAACGVAAARASAEAHGGDPRRIALLGWSDGAMVAALVALGAVTCPGAGSAPAPALLGVAGYFGWSDAPPSPRDSRAEAWFGGSPATAGQAWSDGNPLRWLHRAADLCVHLVVGEQDPVAQESRRFADALASAGARVRLDVQPYGGDQTLLSPRTEEGRAVVRAVHDLLDDCSRT